METNPSTASEKAASISPRRLAIPAALIACGISLSAYSVTAPSSSDAGPLVLVASPSRLEIGPGDDDNPRQPVTFTLTNSGEDIVLISALHASCGCTEFSAISNNRIAPRDTLTIAGVVNLPFSKSRSATIDVVATTPSGTSQTLTIPLVIKPRRVRDAFIADPPALIELKARKPSEELRHRFLVNVIEPPHATEILLSSIETDVPGFETRILSIGEARTLNSIQNERTVECEVSGLAPRAASDVLFGAIHFINVDGERLPQQIPFKVVLQRSIRMIPESLTLDIREHDKPRTMQLLLVSDEAFSLDEIKCSPGLSVTRQNEVTEARVQEICVSFLQDEATFDDLVVGEIAITSPTFPNDTFTVPVKFTRN